MRAIRLASVLALLASLAACSDPVQPSQRYSSTGAPRFVGGLYMGSGLSATAPSSMDSLPARGAGYLGNGY
jgi:hypothetical protein